MLPEIIQTNMILLFLVQEQRWKNNIHVVVLVGAVVLSVVVVGVVVLSAVVLPGVELSVVVLSVVVLSVVVVSGVVVVDAVVVVGGNVATKTRSSDDPNHRHIEYNKVVHNL